MDEINIIASSQDQGKRIDKLLAETTPFSRTRLQALLREGAVSRNGKLERHPRAKVLSGDRLSVQVPANLVSAKIIPEPIPLSIAFEDEHIIIIDKPAGLVVHPDATHKKGTLVHALYHHCGARLSRLGGSERAGIVPRLDKGTSGLIVCAKTEKAHIQLAQQFAAHGRDEKLDRAYVALVWGNPPPGPETIQAPIGRHPLRRYKMAVRQFGGRDAITQFRLLERCGTQASLLYCRLFTGRTHQIRVHLLSQGYPLIGDPLYRLRKYPNQNLIQRQALHATRLSFIHPLNQKRMSFNSPLPLDITQTIHQLKQSMPDT